LNSPRFTVNLTVQQEFDLGAKLGTFIARWDGAWKDDTFFDATEGRGFPLASLPDTLILPEGTLAQEAFWLHNLRFTYREPTEVLELSAWVQNLTDETIKVFSIDASAFLNSTLYFLGDRRTYGASVRMTF
jgi:outer membrane receptor protein involved in Fe transport